MGLRALPNSLYGIEIKATPKRGGYVRGVTVRDCTAPRVILHSVSYNDDGEPAPRAAEVQPLLV